jgi:fatty acid desaturase
VEGCGTMSSGEFLPDKPARKVWNRSKIYLLSRSIICAVVVISIGTLFLRPANFLQYLIDTLLRTYLMFVGTVMAHEGVHGHLGRTRAANFGWGRFALLPTMVPYTNFRKTHHLHHAHTNIPGQDPDHFMKSRNLIEIVVRAVAMPHHWFFWLWKRGRIQKKDLIELMMNYVAIFSVYGVILAAVGASRLFWGMTPALVLVSVLLWYPFAVQTHEGFSTGPAKLRSHNYYGRFMFWFSLGLAIHREHHLQPKLSWIELKEYVENAPVNRGKLRFLSRDIRIEAQLYGGTNKE